MNICIRINSELQEKLRGPNGLKALIKRLRDNGHNVLASPNFVSPDTYKEVCKSLGLKGLNKEKVSSVEMYIEGVSPEEGIAKLEKMGALTMKLPL